MESNLITFVLTVVFVLVALIFILLVMNNLSFWLKATMSGCPIAFLELLKMQKEGIPRAHVVDAYILARKAGLPVRISEIIQIYREHGKDQMMKNVISLVNESRTAQEVLDEKGSPL